MRTPSRKAGRIPLINTRFSLSVENERTDAGLDGRFRLARPHSQARTGTGNIHFFSSADHEQDWQSYPVDPYSVESADHTSYFLRMVCMFGGF